VKALRVFFGYLAPIVVIAAIAYFVYYSLNIYNPSGYLPCGRPFIARETDVAIHVVRQWFGREGETYTGCVSQGS
jgi:hypothetical protein